MRSFYEYSDRHYHFYGIKTFNKTIDSDITIFAEFLCENQKNVNAFDFAQLSFSQSQRD